MRRPWLAGVGVRGIRKRAGPRCGQNVVPTVPCRLHVEHCPESLAAACSHAGSEDKMGQRKRTGVELEPVQGIRDAGGRSAVMRENSIVEQRRPGLVTGVRRRCAHEVVQVGNDDGEVERGEVVESRAIVLSMQGPYREAIDPRAPPARRSPTKSENNRQRPIAAITRRAIEQFGKNAPRAAMALNGAIRTR